MANEALYLLIEKLSNEENRARQALEVAQIELAGYYQQLEQIEAYRLDYSKQLTERGLQGLTASEYSHMQKFIVQLDETLTKQKGAERTFKDRVDSCSKAWQSKRQEKRAVELLLEKKEREAQQKLAQKEQKMMDEFVTAQFARRMLDK